MKDTIIPAGHSFLAGTGAPYLRKLQRAETDPKARLRLLSYVMRKDGASIRQIGGALNKPYSTVRDWLVRGMQRGICGRYDEQMPGAPSRLDAQQLEGLKGDLMAGPQECGFESGLWTAKLLAAHIRKKYGVQYASSGIYEMLHRIGFSWQTPRPRHPKSASEPEKREFKKKPGAPRRTIPEEAMPYWQKTRHHA